MFNRPTFCQTPPQSFNVEPCSTRPFGNAKSLAVIREVPVVTFILRLFLFRYPLAVVGAIVAVIVFAFNGVVWRRAFTHVREKGSERLLPTGADGDTALTVVMVLLIFRIIATPTHIKPNRIFRQIRHRFGVGLARLVTSYQHVTLKASTGPRAARCELSVDKGNDVAANAPTDPTAPTVLSVAGGHAGIVQNGQSLKSLSSQIYGLTVQCGHFIFSLVRTGFSIPQTTQQGATA